MSPKTNNQTSAAPLTPTPSPAGYRWAPSDASREEQLLARRALVGVLLDSPQQRPDAPAALLPPGGPPRAAAVKRLAQSPAPIDYREHDDYRSLAASGRGRYRGPRLRETKGAARPNNRRGSSGPVGDAVSLPMTDQERGRAPRRPGTGGRRPKQTPSVKAATARLAERLGEPAEVIEGPGEARTMLWHVDARPWIEEHAIEGRQRGGGEAQGGEAGEAQREEEAETQRGGGRAQRGAGPTRRQGAGRDQGAVEPQEPARAAGMIIGRLSSRRTWMNGCGSVMRATALDKHDQVPAKAAEPGSESELPPSLRTLLTAARRHGLSYAQWRDRVLGPKAVHRGWTLEELTDPSPSTRFRSSAQIP